MTGSSVDDRLQCALNTPHGRGDDTSRQQHGVRAHVSSRPAGNEAAQPSAPPATMLPDQAGDLARLLARMSGHDQEAFAAFYAATSARVYRLAFRILGDQAAAQDITIEVFMQVQRLASTYEPNRGTPLGWLQMLTRSRSIDYLRTKATRQKQEMPLEMVTGIPSTVPDPQESSAAAERRSLVQAALATLSPAQREVIEIAYYGGLSHGEIATRLGQPLGTIKSRIRMAMMVLRHVLRPLAVAE